METTGCQEQWEKHPQNLNLYSVHLKMDSKIKYMLFEVRELKLANTLACSFKGKVRVFVHLLPDFFALISVSSTVPKMASNGLV